MVDFIAGLSFVTLAVVWSVTSIIQIMFRKRLRNDHPDIASRLEMRGGISGNSPKSSSMFLKFLFGKEFLQVDDLQLGKIGTRLLRWYYALFAVMSIFVASFVASAILRG